MIGGVLGWAISTGANSKHTSIDTLNKTNVAISRFGSGSHIMAYVLADQQGWLSSDKSDEVFDFTVLNNFQAMRDSVNSDETDFFMWETFTTKPYHDSGELKRIGQITPPWPAFMFAAHVDLLQNHAGDLQRALKAIEKATLLFMDQKENDSVKLVMDILNYDEEDVRNWFKTVRYAADHSQVSSRALQVTVSTLIKAGVVDAPGLTPESLCDLQIAHLA